MEQNRKRETERLVAEGEAIRQEMAKLKQKYEGSRARNKALSREVKALKETAAAASKSLYIDTRRPQLLTYKACVENSSELLFCCLPKLHMS